MIWLDRFGYPVESIKNHPIINFIRWAFCADLVLTLKQRNRWQRVKYYGLVDTWCYYDHAVPTQARNK